MPGNGRVGAARVDREHVADARLGARDLDALEQHRVVARLELQVVADVHRRDGDAELLPELRAQRADALDQLAALLAVDQRHQLVADLELEHVERRRQRRARRRVAGLARLGRVPGRAARLLRRLGRDGAAHRVGDAAHRAREDQERQRRQARQDREADQDHRHRAEHARVEQQLRGDLAAEVGARRGTGHDDARRGRDQQRRHLRHQAVADGQGGVDLGRVLQRQAALHHADHEAAEDVDAGDQQPGDRVAAHELAGTVHRAVEVRLGLDRAPALARLALRQEPGVELGVDRQLLARHRVQGEARRHLGDAAGALGDDDEVDHHQDEEDHRPDDVAAADHEVAERLDDVAGRTRPLGAVTQDEPRRGDVQREPEQRQDQQHRREGRELERPQRVDRQQQDHQGERDVEREEEVEDPGRHRDHHQHDDDHEGDRQQHLAARHETLQPACR